MHYPDYENRLHKLEAELEELKLSRTQKAIRTFKRNKRLSLAIAGGFLLIPLSLYALSITKSFTFTAGNPTVASEVNANFDQLFTKVNDLAAYHPPIGAIIAWHKSLIGVPALPASGEWVECNGQVLSDPTSPLNGVTIPSLNSPPADPAGGAASTYAGGRFLRGGTISGILQEDRLQGHWHDFYFAGITLFSGGGITSVQQNVSSDVISTINNQVRSPQTDGTNGTPRTATETRPVNMSVVWIMKVK